MSHLTLSSWPSGTTCRNEACHNTTQRGFSLLEALIAVLVLSIGLLGVAALQANALRNNQSSLERSMAVAQSYSILEAMRANVAAARNRNYDIGMTCVAPAGGSLITNDQRRWILDLQANVGVSACGSIACSAATPGLCTITVQWDDSRGTSGNATNTAGNAAQTITTVSQL